ncbi:MAG TPA: helix-turn-helix domain-containing protein [Thermoanaerobaculia bacterium]|nr:helix-turn-helix domain-containing protein [Thermoanaerobaculia bacterium]
MRRRIPSALGATLRFLRFSKGWSGGDLAEAFDVSPSLISDYEKGAKPLSRERLEGLLGPLDVPGEAIDAALLALELLNPDEEVPPNPGDPTPEERRRIVRAAARIGACVTREIRTGLTCAVRESRLEEDRRRAGEVWDVLRQLSPKERKAVVDVGGEYLGWAVCERLCEESAKAAADKAERAVELADLALRLADRTPGPESTPLQGYAWAFVGNARRVQGNLPDANEAFRRSHEIWQKDAADLIPLDEARILDLEATLLQYQGRFEDVIALLEQAVSLSRTDETRVRLLIQKAINLLIAGKHDESIAALSEVERSFSESTPLRLMFSVRFNIAANLSSLKRFCDAWEMLPSIRKLAVDLGNELDLVRVLWLEARVLAGLERRGEAITSLEQVRGEFTTRAIAYDTALVCLELAVLHLEESRTREVKEMATQMLWIFRSQGVHREALAALRLFHEAAGRETATVEMARSVLGYLEKARHAPGLRFEG